MKKVLLGIVGLIILASWIGRSSSDSSSATNVRDGVVSGKSVEVVSVYADRLFDDYGRNEVATDLSLKGKIVEVKGHVKSIDKSLFDSMYVVLETGNQFDSAQMHVIPSQEDKIAALRKGQFVVFRCSKMTRILSSPVGNDCVLM
jgi:hypothetical protein